MAAAGISESLGSGKNSRQTRQSKGSRSRTSDSRLLFFLVSYQLEWYLVLVPATWYSVPRTYTVVVGLALMIWLSRALAVPVPVLLLGTPICLVVLMKGMVPGPWYGSGCGGCSLECRQALVR